MKTKKEINNSWLIIENNDSYILRARKCLNEQVIKIQVWSTNPGYGDHGITTMDISIKNLKTIFSKTK